MALYLECGLCGHKQAEGLLSRAAWGQVELEAGKVARVCPTCKNGNGNWQDQLRTKTA